MTAQFIIGHEDWIAKVTEEDSRLLSEIFENREMVFLLEVLGGFWAY